MTFVDQMVRKITSLLKFSSIIEEHLYESHPYFQYSRKYDFKNFQCYSQLRDHFSIFWHFWGARRLILVNKWSLLFQKCTQVRDFDFFHFWVFIAFNSRDMTMLWVLNLCSRSSPTQLWKRIFDLRSQKFFFDTQSWQAVNFSHIDSVGNVKFESEISMKIFFSTKFFFVL